MPAQVNWWHPSVARGAQTTNKVNAVRVLMPSATMLQWLVAADLYETGERGQILVPSTVPRDSCYHIFYDPSQVEDRHCKQPILKFRPFELRSGFEYIAIAMVELELNYHVAIHRIILHTIGKTSDLEADWKHAIESMSTAINAYKLKQYQDAAQNPPQLPTSWGNLTSQLNLPVVMWLRPANKNGVHGSVQGRKRRHTGNTSLSDSNYGYQARWWHHV